MPRSKTREKIQDYLSQRNVEGEPPTVREIAAAVGLKSPSSVQKHLKALEREGVITQGGRGRSRSWRLSSTSIDPTIPIVGRIESGEPVDSNDELATPLPISPTAFHGWSRVFAYRVCDDALVAQGILCGDYVLIGRAAEPNATDTSEVGALLTWHRRRTGAKPPIPGGNSAENIGEAVEAPVAVVRLPESAR